MFYKVVFDTKKSFLYFESDYVYSLYLCNVKFEPSEITGHMLEIREDLHSLGVRPYY